MVVVLQIHVAFSPSHVSLFSLSWAHLALFLSLSMWAAWILGQHTLQCGMAG